MSKSTYVKDFTQKTFNQNPLIMLRKNTGPTGPNHVGPVLGPVLLTEV